MQSYFSSLRFFLRIEKAIKQANNRHDKSDENRACESVPVIGFSVPGFRDPVVPDLLHLEIFSGFTSESGMDSTFALSKYTAPSSVRTSIPRYRLRFVPKICQRNRIEFSVCDVFVCQNFTSQDIADEDSCGSFANLNVYREPVPTFFF